MSTSNFTFHWLRSTKHLVAATHSVHQQSRARVKQDAGLGEPRQPAPRSPLRGRGGLAPETDGRPAGALLPRMLTGGLPRLSVGVPQGCVRGWGCVTSCSAAVGGRVRWGDAEGPFFVSCFSPAPAPRVCGLCPLRQAALPLVEFVLSFQQPDQRGPPAPHSHLGHFPNLDTGPCLKVKPRSWGLKPKGCMATRSWSLGGPRSGPAGRGQPVRRVPRPGSWPAVAISLQCLRPVVPPRLLGATVPS